MPEKDHANTSMINRSLFLSSPRFIPLSSNALVNPAIVDVTSTGRRQAKSRPPEVSSRRLLEGRAPVGLCSGRLPLEVSAASPGLFIFLSAPQTPPPLNIQQPKALQQAMVRMAWEGFNVTKQNTSDVVYTPFKYH